MRDCRACTVRVDGKAVNSCIFPVMEIEGKQTPRSMGLAVPGNLDPIRRRLSKTGRHSSADTALRGWWLSARRCSMRTRINGKRRFSAGLAGNLCRCTDISRSCVRSRRRRIEIEKFLSGGICTAWRHIPRSCENRRSGGAVWTVRPRLRDRLPMRRICRSPACSTGRCLGSPLPTPGSRG